MPRDSKVHGMILFHKRSRNYHLSQDNLAKLKKCIRPSFEQEILPVLFRIEGEEPHLLQFLDIHATEETTHNVLLFNQPPFGAVLPLMPEQKPIMEEDITGTIPNKCSCS
jgi:hypothetical protein